jgi:hypothetical protein
MLMEWSPYTVLAVAAGPATTHHNAKKNLKEWYSNIYNNIMEGKTPGKSPCKVKGPAGDDCEREWNHTGWHLGTFHTEETGMDWRVVWSPETKYNFLINPKYPEHAQKMYCLEKVLPKPVVNQANDVVELSIAS